VKRIGVLALQGGFDAHARALFRAGLAARRVRAAVDLDGLDGLVLPGGESTVQLKLIARLGLEGGLRELARRGRPVLATCAGLILAARAVTPDQPSFGWLDVAVDRNGWGAQVDSFEADDDAGARRLVFIRAPRIRRAGPGVEVLARYRGEPVLVRQGRVTGACFHPELVDEKLHAEVFGTA
jgi:5'-phosphate synthase pdxT subunit